MKLLIIENGLTRRDFLRKSISGGTAAATGKYSNLLGKSASNPLDKCKRIYNSLTEKQQDDINNSLFNIINGFNGSIIKNGVVYDTTSYDDKMIEVAPVEAIFGQLASAIDEWGDEAPALVLSGGNPSLLHKMAPEYFDALMKTMADKFGIERFVRLLSDGAYEITGDIGGILSTWEAALLNKDLVNYTGVIQEMLKKASSNGLYLKNLIDGGILSQKQAIEWRKYINRSYRKPAENNKESENKIEDKVADQDIVKKSEDSRVWVCDAPAI